jgi:hypothetical protein
MKQLLYVLLTSISLLITAPVTFARASHNVAINNRKEAIVYVTRTGHK